ncbi:hypothetical protein [Brevibacillus laterosporus]|uniref:WD40 repeat domain-containing protein n=1 Tax=Brevibacillus laterosporus TaxID=1465 RepID=A0AAP8U6H7_BRELA|nr:hypothetical protein [Brevibacillus laterosporus]PPB10723.1 hypothetical protein C4A77_03595 [Brevibacillus laterosporus]
MDWLNKEVAAAWREEGKRYASDVNRFIREMKEMEGKQEPAYPSDDQRTQLAEEVFEMIKTANKKGEWQQLRKELPPATWPLATNFEKAMQAVRSISFLDRKTVVFTAGATWDKSSVFIASEEGIQQFPELSHIGCSMDGSVYALVGQQDIRLIRHPDRHLQGEEIAVFRWEDILTQIKSTIPDLKTLADCEYPEAILEAVIPFTDGKSLLLASGYGIYLVEKDQVSLLHPSVAECLEYEAEDTDIDMPHASVSRDERWIAFGSQSSDHVLVDRRTKETHTFYPESSYPHYCLFSKDNQSVWFNSCHFYNGMTFRVPLKEVENGQAKAIEDWPIMDEESRVYSAVALTGGTVLGHAYGYVRFINQEGQELWRHFVGSTISGIAVSEDESLLAVGTYGGMLHLLDLQAEAMDEYGIGTGTLRECERFIIWREMDGVLRW